MTRASCTTRAAGASGAWELDLKRLEKAQRYLDRMAAQGDDAANRLNAFVEGA